jgi:hypothetical protein
MSISGLSLPDSPPNNSTKEVVPHEDEPGGLPKPFHIPG